MEPPVKRRRLGEPLQAWDDDEEEFEDDWEEYDGDDDTEAAPAQKQPGSVERDDGYQLAIEKAYADDRFRATMARIFEKYDRDFEGIGDEIDLSTGEIIVNNGHIENMRHEVDVGIPGEEADYESESESEEVEDDGDGDLSGEDDVEEEEEEGEEEDIVLLKDSSDHDMAKTGSKTVDENDVQMEATVDNQPWATDTDDTDAMLDYMHLQGPYPDPDALDGIPGYNQGAAAEDGPSLLSGLYDGGGLRYASSLGPYGSSPFALGPWEMLPQVQEGCEFPEPSGLSSAWAADYRYREQPSMRMHSNLASPRSSDKWPKSMPSPAAYNSKDIEMEDSGNSANLFEQHPEEASAFSAEGNQTAVSGEVRLSIQAKSPIRRTRTPHIASVEDSDTVEDPVFSAGDLETSSQTGDDALVSTQAHKPEASNRVIPDSQDTCLSQEDDAVPPTAPTGARASYNKPSHQNFDLACMLSDDETPLFTLPPGVTINNHPKKVVGSVANPGSVGISGISSDDTAVKRGRGRPRKYPRPDGHGQQSDSSQPKKHKSRFKVPAPYASATRIDPDSRNSSIPAQPTYFVPNVPGIPTFAAADQSEAESGTKRKRGRPRKSETPQQQAQQPFMHYPAQMFGQPYFFPPFQFGFQPQSFHHPFQATMQQPFQAFQTFPPQMAYQPLQTSYPQQPLVQFQQQMIQQPIQQLLQQPSPQPRPVSTGENTQQEPVKRKRGRPRKYPVGYKRVRRKVQIPGLQNGMTAFLSGHPNITPVTEDAWYGVARQLAHDISSLQGGYFLSNGFQVQTQTYEPGIERPRLSPKKQFEDSPSESASEGELELHDTGRITEVLDNANDAMSSKPPSGDAHRADGSETFEDSECSEDSESSELAANDDDAGFAIMESPKSVAQSVEPTPSPPSPPMSTRRSSPSTREKHSATTPTPVRNMGSRTPTSIQVSKSRTPVSHKSDAFDLPSSPMSRHIRTGLSSKASIAEAAYTELTDFEEELILPVEDDVTDFARDDEAPPVDPADLQSLLPNETLADLPTEPVAFMDVSSVTTPSTPKSKKASSATFTPQGLLKTRSPTPLTDPDEIFAPSQPGMDGIPSPSARTPTASPSLFVSSPVQTAPRTPDQPRSNLAATVTRQSPLPRAAMVPRSAERCTPIFLDVKRPPPKWPNVTEKRTMGDLKQAMIAPKTKAQDSRSQGPKQMSLKSMFGQVISDKPVERKEDIRSSLPTAEAKRYSSLKVPGTKVSTTSKPSRQLVPEAEINKDKKRQGSRRSLLSLVSGSGKGQEGDDDEDELGSPVQSKSSSSSKLPRSFIASEVGVHSTRKIWKSTPRTTEDPVRPERERAKEKKSKKKRRHTEGSVSKRSGPATSNGNTNGQECGVDGYTCNRDFCFTCL